MAAPSSPNLIDFGDSPRTVAPIVTSQSSLLDDPFSMGGAAVADPFAVVSSSSSVAPPTSMFPSTTATPPQSTTTAPSSSASTVVPSSSSSSPLPSSIPPAQLHFFVSCTGVDGNSIQPTTRSAQNLMRGALSMLTQTSVSKTKSPRGKPPTDVCVEVRVTREFVLPGQEPSQTQDSGALLESESYWSERRKSRNPHFAVGFTVACHVAAMRDRHVQIMIMIPEEGSASTKNAQLFGYAQATFQELYTIATSSDFTQKMTLPVHSTVLDGATVEIRCANIAPLVPRLFDSYHRIFKSFLFYPLMKEEQQAVAPKLAIEEASEVDFSVKIPLQLLQVCQLELRQMHDEWRARYNYNRKKNRFFEDDAEALNFGHDVFRVQVICGRNLTIPSGGANGAGANGAGGASSADNGASRPSTFSLAAGRAGIMNRLKTQAGGGSSSRPQDPNSSPVNAFVVVKICDGNGSTQEHVVGKTNTEYESASPVFSMNKSPGSCPHGKPNTKLSVSPSLPSRVEVSSVNQLKQFLFYRPSLARQGLELGGWLRLEVYNESYGIMSGIDSELIGEVLIPLQSLRDAMTVEETIVWEGSEDDEDRKAHSVNALRLVDWFDVRHPSSDEPCGQLQLRLQILLANPAVNSPAELSGDGSDPVLSPRRQRLAADSLPPTSNPLESEMPLAFLYPHVLTLQKQIANVADMLRLCQHLVDQKKTFKSSQHKKRADIQAIPTNLHVSYFRVLRHFGASTISRTDSGGKGTRRASTEDLLGLHSPPPLSAIGRTPSMQDRRLQAETHATITCGAPTAHAMGLSEYGLREMELEIHRLQGILDRCNPRMTSSIERNREPPPEFISEDAAEYAFSSLQDDIDDNDSEDGGGSAPSSTTFSAPSSTTSSPASVEATPVTASKPSKKYSNLATRAVAGAKKAAIKRTGKHKQKKKSPGGSEGEDSGGSGQPEIKYPPLKTEPDDGVDPLTSTAYAVRVLCRLEMLRAEYYLRKSVSVSQSVSSLVACFVAKLDLLLREQQTQVLEQLATIGFLIGWESLISSHGKELRMLSDAWVAIKCLETFAFQLYQDDAAKDVVLAKREDVGYTIRVPVASSLFGLLPQKLQDGGLISITSVLFTQGINEMQSLANMVGHAGVSIQTKINTSSFRSIVEYYNKFASAGLGVAESHVGSHPDEILRNLRGSVESENSASKNTHILFHAADAVRSLNGGRITYCKSGKDRTAMSVTLEQARLLVQRKRHVLEELLEREAGGSASESGPLEEVKDVANTMREFGVRIDIAKKNVGRFKYSFNSIQRKLLPEIYRPPMSTVQDLVTSVTARDS